MATNYIPTTQTLLAAWSANFSGLISANPSAYGMMASDAATIANAYSLFNNALNLALNPATKTKGVVADKNAKQAAMLSTLRQYAQVIKRNMGISNEAKIGLGLTINDAGRSPVPAPTTAPVLSISNGTPLHHRVRFADEAAPDRRGKPDGVQGIMLAVTVGTAPPTDLEHMPIYGLVTRQPFDVEFSLADKGKTAYYHGQFMTGAGLTGPWSALAQLIIGG